MPSPDQEFKGDPIPQDMERFRYLAPEKPAVFPPNYSGSVEIIPTRVLIERRLAKLEQQVKDLTEVHRNK